MATMFILGLPLKAALYFYRVFAASQDSDAVEALLPMPDAAIADVANVLFRKCLIGRLEFLQADDVGLRLLQPFQQARQAGLVPVDLVGSPEHKFLLCSHQSSRSKEGRVEEK